MDLGTNLIHRVNIGDIVTRNAERRPSHEAVIDGARRFTWATFNDLVNQIADGLLSRGLVRADALAIVSRNSAEFLAVYFACAKIGVVVVPCNLMWKQGELEYVLRHSGSRCILVQPEYLGQVQMLAPGLPRLREILLLPGEGTGAAGRTTLEEVVQSQPAAEPEIVVLNEDPVSYLYTSGTTSAPKGVMSSHLALYLAAMGMALDTGMSWRDRALALLPLFHTSPLNSLCTPAAVAGATIDVHPGFDAAAILNMFQDEGITTLLALPMMYRAMLDLQQREPRRIEKLRLALYAMAPMPARELERAIQVFGCEFGLIFGQTEMSPVTSFFRPEHQLSHSGSAGLPITNVRIGIMGENGTLLPQGETGEIVYRSPQTMTGYLENPNATVEAFRHGWFHSGDIGQFDSDGQLWFRDRAKDVIKTGGENVASVEVEQALYDTEPGLQEVVVIGLPHPHWGEAVTAIAVPKLGRAIDETGSPGSPARAAEPLQMPKGPDRGTGVPEDRHRKGAEGRTPTSVRRALRRWPVQEVAG